MGSRAAYCEDALSAHLGPSQAVFLKVLTTLPVPTPGRAPIRGIAVMKWSLKMRRRIGFKPREVEAKASGTLESIRT